MSEIIFNNTRSYSYCNSEKKSENGQSSNTNSSSNSNSNPVRILTRLWNTLTRKVEHYRFQRPSIAISQDDMKSLGKSFRRSLRINKSAKKKGYDHLYTDEERR